MFEFESKIALTINSVVNKKRRCVAIMFIKIFQNCLVRLSIDYTFNNLWPEQIFAKIVKARDQNNISEGHCRI